MVCCISSGIGGIRLLALKSVVNCSVWFPDSSISIIKVGPTGVWMGDNSGNFSVGSVKEMIQNPVPGEPRSILDWNLWVPLKVKTFAWRPLWSHLPTIDNLSKRRLFTGPNVCNVCHLCLSAKESTEHIFTACYVAALVWNAIRHFHKRKLVQAVIMVARWSIWRARNNSMFCNKSVLVVIFFSVFFLFLLFWCLLPASVLLAGCGGWF